jgi:hypothetical protein
MLLALRELSTILKDTSGTNVTDRPKTFTDPTLLWFYCLLPSFNNSYRF